MGVFFNPIDGNSYAYLDPIAIPITLTGDAAIVTLYPSPIVIATTLSANQAVSIVVRSRALTGVSLIIPIVFSIDADYKQWLIPKSDEWVWTSRIGQMDFTDSDTGEVTKRPMSYNGVIYSIKKVGNQAVIMGENGISVMVPSGTTWALKNIHPIGIKGKNCAVQTVNKVVFIDNKNSLGIITEGQGLQFIDYSQYFELMSQNTVMSYDPSLDIIYIADGTYGFIYSDSGLGQGPTNISGLGYQNDTLFATAPSQPLFDALNICTDIIDFGVRTEKEIYEIDCGMSVVVPLYACIDYRWSKAQEWFTSPWVKADYQGRTFHYNISGVEFRIRIKLASYEYVELDYVNVLGKMADLKPLKSAAA